MSRLAIWSLMIFLIFNLASIVRADQTTSSVVKTASLMPALHTAAVPTAGQVQQSFVSTNVAAPHAAGFQQTAVAIVSRGAGTSLPEPASVVLLTIGAMLVFGHIRREA